MKAPVMIRALQNIADPKKAAFLPTFFKTGKGQYGEGDVFLGVSMPDIRLLAKTFRESSLQEIEKLLQNKYHEVRMLGAVLLTLQFQDGDEKEQKKIFDFYLSHTKHINNWDLVDVSAHLIVGAHLLKRERSLLLTLAKTDHLWTQRIAMVSTLAFIRVGETDDTFRLAKIFLKHKHDLMHKATGWMLREAGKKDLQALRSFLDENAASMPRTMLRYAIEKMEEGERKKYLGLHKP